MDLTETREGVDNRAFVTTAVRWKCSVNALSSVLLSGSQTSLHEIVFAVHKEKVVEGF